MALRIPSYPGDRTSTTPVKDAHVEIITFSLNTVRRTVDFTVGYFRSTADHDAGADPVGTAEYHITPNAEVRGDGATIPGYADVIPMARTAKDDPAGTLAFALVERAIFGLLLTLPEYAGATEVA
jgi:hypothetical protein